VSVGRNSVFISLGLVVVGLYRVIVDPNRLNLGAAILLLLVFVGITLGVTLQYRGRLAGSRERRAAMDLDGLEWIADVRMDRASLERLIGARGELPETVALGTFDTEVEVWLDARGKAALLPEVTATLVKNPRNPDAPYGITLDGPDGVIAFDVVGPIWGLLPSSRARTFEVVVLLNGPYRPGV
jgi:hypothetical protein